MQKHYYDLRFKVDEEEWRARVKRELIFQFWDVFAPKGKKTIKMLDLGCGSGLFQYEFEKRFPGVKSWGIDISKEAISYCRARGIKKTWAYNGKTIPFKDNYFDSVKAIDVLEHIQNDRAALDEIKRVLKNKGLGFFLVPAHKTLWSTRDIRLKHKRRYENGELEEKCREAGFKLLISKNVDFALYFVLLIMCKFSPRKNKVPHLTRETALTNYILDYLILKYEQLENKLQNYLNFPIGISKLIIVEKN
ncbi:hypothetical protein A2960_03200 [Candidatus Gottesmanbacteria bacterium RIFCSPLOWO2_01_FULL_39_12b]|uniref:Methyltransferase type 11 domain-containing protein n=1 Tax=Candidatus Gottesmanbacteria bacterium RIFCSPLOWO2_01_FULL_39_12b TaxID=1798388 RepID=A0A1F6AR77_9BACT|nr:MAG: hypothetical protein A2960_03200 [Candidatus Gottesmanbacteria bacterium RIFCSPLOWO2_01_FULL_39_12b]